MKKCTKDHTGGKYQTVEFRSCNLFPWPKLEISVFPGAILGAGGGDGEPRLVGSCLRVLEEGRRAGIANPVRTPGLCLEPQWEPVSQEVSVPDYLRHAQDEDQ